MLKNLKWWYGRGDEGEKSWWLVPQFWDESVALQMNFSKQKHHKALALQ